MVFVYTTVALDVCVSIAAQMILDTPRNNENVRLSGVRFSISGNYFSRVRIPNFFSAGYLFGGSKFEVRMLFLAICFLVFEFRNDLDEQSRFLILRGPAGGKNK